jgi:hypothetical protein
VVVMKRMAVGIVAALLILAGSAAAALTSSNSGAPVPPATQSGSPAVAINPTNDHLYVFWQGEDGQIYETWFDGSWHGPRGSGWQASSTPAAAASDAGVQHVAWRGVNGDVWQATNAAGAWGAPLDTGRPTTSAPAVAVRPNTGHVFLFWRGLDGLIHENDGTITRALPYATTSAPAAGADDAGNVYLFWRGADGHVWEAVYAHGHWQPAVRRRVRTVFAPAVGVNPRNGHLYVFRVDDDYWVRETFFNGRWVGPLNIWPTGSAPAVAVGDDGHQFVFWQREVTTQVWEYHYFSSRAAGNVNLRWFMGPSHPCRIAQLAISAAPGAASSYGASVVVRFHNISSHGCLLAGYPSATMLDVAGRRVGPPADWFTASNVQDFLYPAPPAFLNHTPVIVPPDGWAVSTLWSLGRPRHCAPSQVAGVQLAIPHSSRSTVAPVRLAVCAADPFGALPIRGGTREEAP